MSRELEDAAPERPSRRGLGRVITLLVLVGAVVAFVVGNTQRVPVHLGFTTARPQLIWAVVGSLAVGIVIGFLGGRGERGRRDAEGRGRRGR